MLTPDLEQRAQQLLAKIKRLTGNSDRSTVGIFVYWTVCQETEGFLEELMDCRSGGAIENPMFDSNKTGGV